MTRRLSDLVLDRRRLLAAGGLAASAAALPRGARGHSSFTYTSLRQRITDDHQVADGYRGDVLIGWGDALDGSGPATDLGKLTPQQQAARFGANNDFLAFLPLPRGGDSSDHGLLWANHEFPSPQLMFPAGPRTADQVRVMQASLGGSVVEVRRGSDGWGVVPGSRYARRIDANSRVRFSGPAAGAGILRLQGGEAPCGTLANCAGGKTPWGTILTAEENLQGYFGKGPKDLEPAPAPGEVDIRFDDDWTRGWYGWEDHDPRFDLSQTQDEPWRYGWIVEVDPYDPTSVPVKRTALGRMKHEGATSTVTTDADGQERVVLYLGDDQNDGFLYRFVSAPTTDPTDPALNRDLLDRGVLSVARFTAERLEWVPLVAGEGELASNDTFRTQEDVALRTREAARSVGATPMDRPEDVEATPSGDRVFVALMNHTSRHTPNPANPRTKNLHGHVLELTPPGGDHSADAYAWEVFLLGGDPWLPGSGASAHPSSEVWLSCPDNLAFDPRGRLWISSDQGSAQLRNGIPDGVFTADTDGEGRRLLKQFYACPIGAELCGPEFTPDGSTLFVAVQHPGEVKGSTFDDPVTRWPDMRTDRPPRSSVVALTYADDRRAVLGD